MCFQIRVLNWPPQNDQREFRLSIGGGRIKFTSHLMKRNRARTEVDVNRMRKVTTMIKIL